MNVLARLGLAIVRPRFALAHAAERQHAGRSGSDLIVLILFVILATQLRALLGAAWLGKAVDGMLGFRAAMQILTRSLTVDLAFLVLGALVLFVVAGPKRKDRGGLGRAFDLACVAAVPLLVVELVVTTIVRLLDLDVPMPLGWVFATISWGWAGALLALGARAVRSTTAPPALEPAVKKPARVAGWVLAGIVVAGTGQQITFVVRHIDSLRPVTIGNTAPAFALPTIEQGGALGPKRGITPGRVTVIDFWATWCQPCIAGLPKLQRIAREMPDVEVITINLDDPAKGRALYDQNGITLVLLADDGAVSERYSVAAIPHTVVIGRDGTVERVFRGGTTKLEAAVQEIRK